MPSSSISHNLQTHSAPTQPASALLPSSEAPSTENLRHIGEHSNPQSLPGRVVSFVGSMIGHVPVLGQILLPLLKPTQPVTENKGNDLSPQQLLLESIKKTKNNDEKAQLINSLFNDFDKNTPAEKSEAKRTLDAFAGSLLLEQIMLRSYLGSSHCGLTCIDSADDSYKLMEAGISFDTLSQYNNLPKPDLHPQLNALISNQLLLIMVKAATRSGSSAGQPVKIVHNILNGLNQQLQPSQQQGNDTVSLEQSYFLIEKLKSFPEDHLELTRDDMETIEHFETAARSLLWQLQPDNSHRLVGDGMSFEELSAHFELPMLNLHPDLDELLTHEILSILIKASSKISSEAGDATRQVHSIIQGMDQQLAGEEGTQVHEARQKLKLLQVCQVGHLGLSANQLLKIKHFEKDFANLLWAQHYTKPKEVERGEISPTSVMFPANLT